MTAQEARNCQNCKQEFWIESEDFDFYRKINVPPPTFCSACRFQRRLAFRNERTLYRRKCDLCGEMKVSNFRPDSRHPVYCPPCWWSDKWSAIDYAQDYDSSRPFLEQFIELRNRVPQAGRSINQQTMVNSEYCHMAGELRNCYLVTHANECDNCFYCSAVIFNKDSGELLSSRECELCLELVCCEKCHRVYFSLDCESCHDVAFSRNCVGCSNCFGCVNLRNKQYYIFNQRYTKEDYFEKLKEFDLGSYQALAEAKRRANLFWQKFPQKYIHGRHNTNVSGDYVYHSKNALSCYDVVYAEDSKYCQYIANKPVAQCYDYTEWGQGAELVYESVNCGQGFTNSKFGQQSWKECKNIEYTSFCITSSDLFGCVALRNKQYCILNKQYVKEEYEALVPKIIEDMKARPYVDKKGRAYRYGEFLPIEASFWGYNETTANEYFPLTKEQAEAEGFLWTDIDKHKGAYEPTMKAEEIPDHIRDVQDLILNQIIKCKICKKSYRIIKQELDFYRGQGIAIPRWCPECRYKNRFDQRNSFRLYHRKCQCTGLKSENGVYSNVAQHFHGDTHCPIEFETTYRPDQSEIVYCESCYQNEVV